jgi:hypothetical protein
VAYNPTNKDDTPDKSNLDRTRRHRRHRRHPRHRQANREALDSRDLGLYRKVAFSGYKLWVGETFVASFISED